MLAEAGIDLVRDSDNFSCHYERFFRHSFQ